LKIGNVPTPEAECVRIGVNRKVSSEVALGYERLWLGIVERVCRYRSVTQLTTNDQ
jgi:hypothetical protein